MGDVLPQGFVQGGLVVAATRFLHAGSKPANYVLIQPDRNSYLAPGDWRTGPRFAAEKSYSGFICILISPTLTRRRFPRRDEAQSFATQSVNNNGYPAQGIQAHRYPTSSSSDKESRMVSVFIFEASHSVGEGNAVFLKYSAARCLDLIPSACMYNCTLRNGPDWKRDLRSPADVPKNVSRDQEPIRRVRDRPRTP